MKDDTRIKLTDEDVTIDYGSLKNKISTCLFCDIATQTISGNMHFPEDEIKNLLKDRFEIEDGQLNLHDFMKDLVDTLAENFPNQISYLELVKNDLEGWDIDMNLWDSFCTSYVEQDACLED